MRKVLEHCRPATASARELVAELQVRDPCELDIELIAARTRLHVVYKELAHEEGHLVRNATGGLIVVSERAKESEKWRWVIAHELGHFRVHQGSDQFEACSDRDLHAWYLRSGTEAQANAFAAELLMPEHLFKKRCEVKQPSLDQIKAIADAFRTSLTATALRFIAFCPEPCAIVSSSRGQIDWWSSTDDFAFPLKRGFALSRQTYAGDLFADATVPDYSSAISAEGWSDDVRALNREIHEHSIVLGRYGVVLSLLWHPYEDPDEMDDGS